MSLRRITRAIAVIVLFAANPVSAAAPEDCPKWFPDFRCDRAPRYEGFVMPMTAPYLFEEPFVNSGFALQYVHHDFPDDSVLDGGYASVLALQARVAITDRLAFIATKDGYTWLRPGHRLLRDQQGFFDITAGFKYVLIDRPEDNFILTPSLRFEVPTGSSDVFSGNGNGVAIPGVSWGWGLGNFHVLGNLGGQIPFDRGDESTSIFYNFHFDYGVHKHFVPFMELNGQHWTDSGTGGFRVRTRVGTLPLRTIQNLLGNGRGDGNDVVNLGSQGVDGNNIVTLAFGARIPLTKHVHAGFAYEFPVTSREDLFQQRGQVSLNYEF